MIPVFLVLIYYIHDLPKQKLMQRKVQFVAYEIAAILQNMAKQKAEGAKITKDDLSKAFRLANLSVFPGMTQYSTGSSYHTMPLGYMPMLCVFYVVGTGENVAKIKWHFRTYPTGNENYYNVVNEGRLYGSAINIQTTLAPSIHPQLHIKKGEVKIIVEYLLYSDPYMKFSQTGQPTKNVSKRELFNFLLYNPVSRADSSAYFNSVAIFTPIGTGFSEEAPQ